MTTECNTSVKEDNNSCWCKRIFSKDNVFIKCCLLLILAIFACFLYNKVNEWLAYRSLEKFVAEMTLAADNFGFTVRSSNAQLADIDNKILLCYLAKQQAEILKNQKLLNDKLSKLTEGLQGGAIPSISPVNKVVAPIQQQNSLSAVKGDQTESSVAQSVPSSDNQLKQEGNTPKVT